MRSEEKGIVDFLETKLIELELDGFDEEGEAFNNYRKALTNLSRTNMVLAVDYAIKYRDKRIELGK